MALLMGRICRLEWRRRYLSWIRALSFIVRHRGEKSGVVGDFRRLVVDINNFRRRAPKMMRPFLNLQESLRLRLTSEGLWSEKPCLGTWPLSHTKQARLSWLRAAARVCLPRREWPGALGTHRNLVHLGCPRISSPEIGFFGARGSPARTTCSLPKNWWPPSCRGR
ncbi:carbamoyl-phosphate synthase small chain [Striga asiatica]|uniref:Carbamoyl-phosphate synthase small chain n=1 Tax=Striga asiatica TaxID=4170 RepID=A0A5A7RH19_STRAF|nr:carbamoyl-phosphate synthase small chain [Striga asiatica]